MMPGFDIIIDDGSHDPKDQIKSFESLFPSLKCGGVYVVEDIMEPRNNPFIEYLSGKGFSPEFFDSAEDNNKLLCVTKEHHHGE